MSSRLFSLLDDTEQSYSHLSSKFSSSSFMASSTFIRVAFTALLHGNWIFDEHQKNLTRWNRPLNSVPSRTKLTHIAFALLSIIVALILLSPITRLIFEFMARDTAELKYLELWIRVSNLFNKQRFKRGGRKAREKLQRNFKKGHFNRCWGKYRNVNKHFHFFKRYRVL